MRAAMQHVGVYAFPLSHRTIVVTRNRGLHCTPRTPPSSLKRWPGRGGAISYDGRRHRQVKATIRTRLEARRRHSTRSASLAFGLGGRTSYCRQQRHTDAASVALGARPRRRSNPRVNRTEGSRPAVRITTDGTLGSHTCVRGVLENRNLAAVTSQVLAGGANSDMASSDDPLEVSTRTPACPGNGLTRDHLFGSGRPARSPTTRSAAIARVVTSSICPMASIRLSNPAVS